MTSQDFMVWMKKTLPYNGRLWVRKFKNPNWRDSYTVSFHNRNAIELAELLLPESRIKKKQLKILAKYPIGGARTITTPEREKLYWQMREENKKSRQQQRLSEETLRNLNSKIQ